MAQGRTHFPPTAEMAKKLFNIRALEANGLISWVTRALRPNTTVPDEIRGGKKYGTSQGLAALVPRLKDWLRTNDYESIAREVPDYEKKPPQGADRVKYDSWNKFAQTVSAENTLAAVASSDRAQLRGVLVKCVHVVADEWDEKDVCAKLIDAARALGIEPTLIEQAERSLAGTASEGAEPDGADADEGSSAGMEGGGGGAGEEAPPLPRDDFVTLDVLAQLGGPPGPQERELPSADEVMHYIGALELRNATPSQIQTSEADSGSDSVENLRSLDSRSRTSPTPPGRSASSEGSTSTPPVSEHPPPPVVKDLSADRGPSSGGTRVWVEGHGFGDTTKVFFGEIEVRVRR